MRTGLFSKQAWKIALRKHVSFFLVHWRILGISNCGLIIGLVHNYSIFTHIQIGELDCEVHMLSLSPLCYFVFFSKKDMCDLYGSAIQKHLSPMHLLHTSCMFNSKRECTGWFMHWEEILSLKLNFQSIPLLTMSYYFLTCSHFHPDILQAPFNSVPRYKSDIL